MTYYLGWACLAPIGIIAGLTIWSSIAPNARRITRILWNEGDDA